MKSIIVFILGIVGFASAVGAGYLLIMDHGLAKNLYQQDAKLQQLPTEKRREVLNQWIQQVNEGAAIYGDESNRKDGDGVVGAVRNQMPTFDEVEGYFQQASTRFEAALAALKQDDESASTQLDQASSELDKAASAYETSKPEEQSSIRQQAGDLATGLKESLNRAELKEASETVRKKVQDLYQKAKELAGRSE